VSKPETRFYSAVHKLLPSKIHREKMHNTFRGGTPDVWYSGNRDDLWVEYKWLANLPKRVPVRTDKLLSPLQIRWLRKRYEEGRNVVVILGSPQGAWVFESLSWEAPLSPDEIRAANLSKQNVADYIKHRTTLE
jgi:hypothetical protein